MAAVDQRVPVEQVEATVPPSVRAQLLATEHWSLLATRGMTWSEVMSRITIHLTVTSATLVVLALVVQVSGFGTAFTVMSIGLTSAVLLLGTLTGLRINNASHEDAALVLAMNRLRAAYVELDPAMARYLVASWHDDHAGLMHTYALGMKRSVVSHVAGSTAMFVTMVNSLVAGTLGGLVAYALDGGPVVISVTGVLAGLAYLGVQLEYGRRTYGADQLNSGSRCPTPGA
jgi:hypothetical protein